MKKERLSGKSLHGVITALITPLNKQQIALEKYEELINLAKDAELLGIVPLGTTGESPVLDSEERFSLIQRAVEAAGDDLYVIAGTGTNSTKTTIQNSRVAADQGADALLIVTPYYNKPTPRGLKKHFTAVADISRIPIILYHIPGRCGVGIPLELVLELSEHENIIGIKEAGGDVWRSGEISRLTDDDFAVISGDDSLTLPLLSVGASAVISVLSNIAPKLMKKLLDFALEGDFQKALEVHRQLSPLFGALTLETNPCPIKEAMNIMGLDVGNCRLPLVGVSAATRKALGHALENVGDVE